MGRVAAHDPEDLGGRPLLAGRDSSGTSRRATCARSPTRSRTRAIWVAALQPATYQLAAEKGIGVMALSVAAPSYLAPAHQGSTRSACATPSPVGKFVNDQWLSSTMGLCDADDKAARELAAKSLRTFFGPDRPYLKDQTHLYEQLVDSWGGVPEHLKANFARYLKTEGTAAGAPEVDLSGGSGQIATALWNQIDADTLVDRGVLVAGDPESCLRSIAIHEAGRRRRAAVPHGDRDGAPRQGDDVHRDVRQARHPRAQEAEARSAKLNAGSSGGSGAPKNMRRWIRGSSGERRSHGSARGTSHLTTGLPLC